MVGDLSKSGSKGEVIPLFFIFRDIYQIKTMANIVISEEQLKMLMDSKNTKPIKEDKDGSYMTKQQLFTIATLAYKMWEQMSDDDQLEDWMESKIAQCEQSVISVVKTYLYDEVQDDVKGMDTLNYNDIVIGK